jgi:hypothetical protein
MPHIVSAILRSCDAEDVYDVHAVWDKKLQIRKAVLCAAKNWVYSEKNYVLKTRLVILLPENRPKKLHPVNGYINSWTPIVGHQ